MKKRQKSISNDDPDSPSMEKLKLGQGEMKEDQAGVLAGTLVIDRLSQQQVKHWIIRQ